VTTSPSSPDFSDIVANDRTIFAPVAPLAWSRNLLQAAYELLVEKLFPDVVHEDDGIVVAAASPSTGEHGGGLISRRERGRPWSGQIGRHEATSLPLPRDGALSLRHAILIAQVTDDGVPILRVLDLRSGTGMFDAEGAPHQSIIANGPLRLRVGNSALFAIPTDDLFRGGRLAAYGDIQWPCPKKWLPDAPPERRLREITHVSERSSSLSLEGGGGRRIARGDNTEPTAGKFVVEVGGLSSDFAVDDVALRRGVLFGRYPRCDINYQNAPMSELISRVHALFLMVDGCVRVFDTGSTNGIGHDGRSADGLALAGDRETRLQLGRNEAITWWPAAGLA
jgi:hypothetical protein